VLSDVLKNLRHTHHYTQQDLADYLGIARGTYAHYEINRREPDIETLKKIAVFYHVSIDYLLELTNNPSPITKEKTPSHQEEVLQDLKDITPEMASEVRQFISYLKHKEESTMDAAAGKK
jgi:hypothetical protein